MTTNAEYIEFKREIIGSLRNYLSVFLFLFTIFGGVIGWNTVERINLTKDYEGLRNDFGIFLITCPPEYKKTIMYDQLIEKYFPKRGQSNH